MGIFEVCIAIPVVSINILMAPFAFLYAAETNNLSIKNTAIFFSPTLVVGAVFTGWGSWEIAKDKACRNQEARSHIRTVIKNKIRRFGLINKF